MPFIREPDKVKTINGEQVDLYYVGALADALGRTSQTVRKWEIAGTIPKAIFKSNGRRMYSEEQIKEIVRVAEECNIRQGHSLAQTGFPKKVHEAIKELNKKYIG
jgi:DNA-binding transcriptional MerR regulator